MKVLVLSNTPWADDNSFGNSFSNIFKGIDGLQFGNVFCRYGAPDNSIVGLYFQITERSLLANLRDPTVPSGRVFLGMLPDPSFASDPIGRDAAADEPDVLNSVEQRQFDVLRTKRWLIFYWARDLIWKFGRWKSPELREFINEFAPDLIFQPIYYSNYLSDIALFIRECAGVPMVGYVSDDVYTLRQFSLSPLYWIDRIHKRRKVRSVIDRCEYLYVISDVQREEYERLFGKRCKVLRKCADFGDGAIPAAASVRAPASDSPLRLVYTGNIAGGRWKTLVLIARSLAEINVSEKKAQLRIYTTTPITAAMRRGLSIGGTSEIMGGIPASSVAQVQQDADILVHVEGFDLASRLQVHQSFSTKIVDYLSCARCILAVGPRDAASIDYFVKNEAAAVASTAAELAEQLRRLVADPALLSEYAVKAWDCGKRNHSRHKVQGELYADLSRISSQYEGRP